MRGADRLAEQFQVNPLARAPSSVAVTDPAQLDRALTPQDPRIERLVKWLRAQAGRHAARPPAAANTVPLPPAQSLALLELRQRVGEDLRVRFRPGTGAPLLIQGPGLQRRATPVGKAGLSLEESTARDFLRGNKDLLRLEDPDLELILRSRETDELGLRHLRFEQRYAGLPVWPCELIVHLDREGSVYLVNGTTIPSPREVAALPALPAEEAVARARTELVPEANAEAAAPVLIIYGPLDQPPRLSWKFSLTATWERAWDCVVDAASGRLLAAVSLAKHALVSGSGADGRGNVRNLSLWEEQGTYYMVDCSKPMFDPFSQPPFNGRGVILVFDGANMQVRDPLFSAGLMQSRSANSGWEGDAVGAAFGLSQTYDYYLDRFGRNSLDGQGGTIRAIVRYGQEVRNAFWFGGTRTMVFGAGYTREIDIAGHELTHGVMDNVGNGGILEYLGQSGALNEALSDIFGEMVEARFKGTAPDWLKRDPLAPDNPNLLAQNYADPTSVRNFLGGINPSKMSEFADLPANVDSGGVHVNSSIINHCYYLLAAGLDGALGLQQAEQIFYRAMTRHLQKQSQFIDMRLACVSAAEEIFGGESAQAKKTAEAFDRVELEDAPTTPPQTPVPAIEALDSTLGVRFDPAANRYYLVRREAALNDSLQGTPLSTGDSLAPRRASVSGDGRFCVFVTANHDLGALGTDGNNLSFLQMPGLVHSVAVAPDGNHYALVPRNAQTGEPLNEIWVVRLNPQETRRIKLTAPGTEGADLDIIKFAGTMDFRLDSRSLVYDAYSEIPTAFGQFLGSWGLFSLDLTDNSIRTLISFNEGLDFGNPSLGQTRDHLITFEVIERRTGLSTLFASNLQTGQTVEIGRLAAAGAIGVPGFSGDDTAVVYAQVDRGAPAGFSLISQPVEADGLTPRGQPFLWLADAHMGLIYRRGQFVSSNALPSVTLTASAGERLTAPAQFFIEATASDPDGAISKVEFYDGSIKLGEAASPPYRLAFSNVPARQFRFFARAVDNLGGAQDSGVLRVAITRPGGGTGPAITIPPRSQTVPVGGSVTFFILATGTPPLRFQWFHNGVTLAGQTNALLSLENVQLTQAGAYRVQVTAEEGSVMSEPADLTVSPSGDPGPLLKVVEAGGALVMSWPVSAGDFVLQSKDRLSSTVGWVNLPVVPTVIGQERSVTITVTGEARFYRLARP